MCSVPSCATFILLRSDYSNPRGDKFFSREKSLRTLLRFYIRRFCKSKNMNERRKTQRFSKPKRCTTRTRVFVRVNAFSMRYFDGVATYRGGPTEPKSINLAMRVLYSLACPCACVRAPARAYEHTGPRNRAPFVSCRSLARAQAHTHMRAKSVVNVRYVSNDVPRAACVAAAWVAMGNS